ncbi:hypothetical protein H2198_002702 [Neophaeococcomyces mojaviensis]|uniref:Uncharacterized protein n=1 Tax=Neophaeococcomyces mojaviensis TaxID=3383035 RepID=A0ACC3ADH1_9EURO|nr:hypothetical protein H2198_002702 [Knufia sp. JES_112]
MPPRERDEEARPLLSAEGEQNSYQNEEEPLQVSFSKDEDENPKEWSRRKRLINVFIIAFMAILSPLASSMFTPGIQQIAKDLGSSEEAIIATTTGFVIFLGVGPLVLAPLSETFGRRIVYVASFAIFTLLQIPTALAPNAATLIVVRTISGFFGSVGIANGGGTINDMYEPHERASIFGWYLLGPLLGPTLGPLFGGIIVNRLNWRWIYWILTIVCAFNTTVGYFLLRETYAPVLLNKKRNLLEQQTGRKYTYEGADDRPIWTKLRQSMKRPIVIFIQPIVLVMSFYQALIFGTTYSIFTNMQSIFSEMPYFFNSEQIGLLYLFPGAGFLFSVWFLVPRIDTVFNRLTEKNGGKSMPEYRLPLANIGGVLLPVSLFWFAWTVQYRMHWAVCMASTLFYGIGQVVIFNSIQNYYIDSFSKYAASALAGGSVFRSIVGGVVPLFAPTVFDKLGYGWGISIFAFLAVAVAPSPILFYYYGPRRAVPSSQKAPKANGA